jgi:xylan 1,4-beta-xylosidase
MGIDPALLKSSRPQRWIRLRLDNAQQRLRATFLLLALSTSLSAAGFDRKMQSPSQIETVTVDMDAPSRPFAHFWERMFGSGHAILSLREAYRDDLRAVKHVTDFEYVRFHGILDDEVGVYNEDSCSRPVFNFSYVDQIYDGLLKSGVRPVVELSFMPRKLAFNPDALHPFWYKPNVSPPKTWDKWDDLITHLAQHLVGRYGLREVSQWYFEVWNEPNIDFWNGIPRESSYFELYDHTARDLKKVSLRLRVGGPATAHASWVPDFLQHAAANKVPMDFISTHAYADDTVENLFGTHRNIPRDYRVCRAVAMVQSQIDSSPLPKLPLLWTEWNVEGMDNARDTIFVGPALASTIRDCDGHVDMMSFWTFDDVFEEDGVVKEPFHGGFGLIAAGGIKKPSYYAFTVLHRLGRQRLANPAANVLVTRRKDGTLVLAAWNLVDPDQRGTPQSVHFEFRHVAPNERVWISRADSTHGNSLAAYAAMGRPQYPTLTQASEINQASALPPPRATALKQGSLDLEIPPDGLVLLEISK